MSKISDIEVANKMQQIQASAKSRGIHFDMSFNRVKTLMNTKRCFYTNNKLNNIKGDNNQLTFDRVDNSLGYIDSNVVACSHSINQKKGCLYMDEITSIYIGAMKKLGKKITK